MKAPRVISSILLILVNSYLLLGIILFEWDSRIVISCYWIETVILIFFSIIKLRKARKYPIYKSKKYPLVSGGDGMAIGLSIFLMLLYIPFIMLVYLKEGGMNDFILPIFLFLIQTVISHGISYKINFLGKKEFEKSPNGKIGHGIITRLMPMHVALIVAFVSDFSIITLVILKTLIDLAMHNYSHKEETF